MTKPYQLLRQQPAGRACCLPGGRVTPLQFSPSCQGGDVTLATSAISPVTAPTAGNQTPGFCGLGGQSRWLLQRRQAATRNVSPTREGVTQNVLEACLPMTVAAALLLPQPPRLSSHQHACSDPVIKGRAVRRSWSCREKRARQEQTGF